ncbi:MAG: alpha-E domain-containing protein [Actinomycetota bacterium]|nr:alpha-E domain-containing protein [Actinomycetota bacterium]
MAESLFWIGRYLERAEGTARILDVVVHHALEEPTADSDVMAGRLVDSMGVTPATQMSLSETTQLLCFERESGSSITGAIAAARENSRAVRNVLPSELWERVNATWVNLPTQRLHARRKGPSTFLSWVKIQTAAITGLADTTMSHDQTWLFFTLGRVIERADMTARLLGTLPLDLFSESGLVTLLRSCGGHEPYLRQANGIIDPNGVIDFLLRDGLFPRSVLCSLTSAATCIDAIGGYRSGGWDPARGDIGMARAELEFLAPAHVLEDLPHLLSRVHSACSRANDSIARQYFAHGPATLWRHKVAT